MRVGISDYLCTSNRGHVLRVATDAQSLALFTPPRVIGIRDARVYYIIWARALFKEWTQTHKRQYNQYLYVESRVEYKPAGLLWQRPQRCANRCQHTHTKLWWLSRDACQFNSLLLLRAWVLNLRNKNAHLLGSNWRWRAYSESLLGVHFFVNIFLFIQML